MANSVEVMKAEQEDRDLAFILNELKGPKRRLISTVASLLRTNALEKEQDDSNKSGLGPELKKSVTTFRQLPITMWRSFFKSLCAHWDAKDVEELSKDKCLAMACVALNVSPTTKLPAAHPALRFECPLLELMGVWAKFLGHRLQRIKTSDDMDAAGYFEVVGTKLKLRHFNKEATWPLLGHATDWVIRDNHVHSARAHSETLGATVNLMDRIGSEGVRDENADWMGVLLANMVPSCVLQALPASGRTTERAASAPVAAASDGTAVTGGAVQGVVPPGDP